MNVSSSSAAQAASAATPGTLGAAVSTLVLKKALNQEASAAMQLLQALPQPALATQGVVGTKVNTFA